MPNDQTQTTNPATLLDTGTSARKPHVDAASYQTLYAESVADPDTFWAKQGQRLDWIQPFTKVKDVDFTLAKVSIKWFEDGVLNVAANCIDRHLEKRGTQTALKANTDAVLGSCSEDVQCLVVKRTGTDVAWSGRDHDYNALAAATSETCAPEPMNAEDPLHPLHLRLDRTAQRRGAHIRRLSNLRRDDAGNRLRPSPGRHLLVHC